MKECQLWAGSRPTPAVRLRIGLTALPEEAKGKLTTLYSFCSLAGCADGNSPQAGLVRGTDGSFYGTTLAGGGYGYGTVFKISAAGKLKTLHNFNGTDGRQPASRLLQATDGNFYGTTQFGGTNDWGTAFKMSSEGKFPTLVGIP